jgi:hypothetical protein
LGQARFLTKYTESDATGVPSWLRTLRAPHACKSQRMHTAGWEGRARLRPVHKQGGRGGRLGRGKTHQVHSAVVLLMKSMMPWP